MDPISFALNIAAGVAFAVATPPVNSEQVCFYNEQKIYTCIPRKELDQQVAENFFLKIQQENQGK